MRISDWSSDVCSSDLVDDSLSHFRELIADYGGRSENIAGDGVYALFDSATKAVRFAAHFQSDVRNAVVWDPSSEPIQYRIGINLEIGRASCREKVCAYE